MGRSAITGNKVKMFWCSTLIMRRYLHFDSFCLFQSESCSPMPD